MATRPNAFSQPVSHAPIDTSLTIGAEQAADAVLEQCVAIICRQCGFDTVTRSALELLKRLVSTYWEELLEEAARDAELAGRPRPNLNDVRRSLEIYGLIQAIDSDTALLSNSANEPSTSRSTEIDTKPPSTHRRKKSKITSPIEPTSTNKPTARIAMADTLKQELLKNNEQEVDHWNERWANRGQIASTREATSIDLQQVASLLGTIDQPTTTTTTTTTITTSPSISTLPNYRPAHIASHMPPLPPGYTYKHTLMVTQRLRDYGALRMESADQSRMVEESLKKLLATTNSTNTISPTDSSVQRSTADTNTSTEQHTETAEKLWSNWPLVNCEFANNRASLPDTDEFSSLPSTSTSSQLHQLSSSMNALLIPATTVLAWPTGVSTAAASGYNQHSSTHGLLSLSRMNHQKSIVNSNRFTNTKTT